MAGVKGDFAGLAKLRSQTRRMHGADFLRGMSQALAAEALELVDEGFASSTDPTGKKWEGLAIRDGQPLRDTGRLQRSFTSEITNRGFSIGTNTRYAKTHQQGMTIKPVRAPALRFQVRGKGWFTRNEVTIPQRRMLPEGARIGAKWNRRLGDAAREYVNSRFG